MPARRWLIVAAAAIALILLLGKALAGVYVDYRWFAALDAEAIWWARVENLLILRGLSGVVATIFFFCNLYAVRHSVVSLVLPRRVANIEIGEEVPSRYLLLAVIGMSLVFGILLAFPQDDWAGLALVRWGHPFREADPYFEYDLGFWTYWLPFETSLHVWSLIALLAATTVVVFLYALTPSLRWERGTLHVSGYVRRHLSLLGALLIFLLAWSYRLDGLGLLLNGTGPLGAFTSADWKVGVPANFVLAFATGAAAVLVGWAAWTGQMRVAFISRCRSGFGNSSRRSRSGSPGRSTLSFASLDISRRVLPTRVARMRSTASLRATPPRTAWACRPFESRCNPCRNGTRPPSGGPSSDAVRAS